MNKGLEQELQNLFREKQEALQFLFLYSAYGAITDDVVDEQKERERIRMLSFLAGEVFNCPYWIKNRHQLYILDRLIHNMYFDSVIWESEPELWKRQHAKIYSHSAMWMTLAVILLEFGEQKMREYSLKLKEFSYEAHKEDKI